MTWSMLLPTMQPDNNWATNGTFSGRAVIQGKVLSIKSNDFSARILVQLTDGWKVFGTLPSSISGVEREQAVEFKTTIKNDSWRYENFLC